MRAASIGSVLRRIDGRGYKAYRDLLGAEERVRGLTLRVVRVQGDPYAPPSVVEVAAGLRLPQGLLRYPVAVADWLYRRLQGRLSSTWRRMGEGRSGFMGLPKPSNAMLRRSGAVVSRGVVRFRVWVGLPSRRRRILGGAAEELLLELLPRAVSAVLRSAEEEASTSLRRHVDAWREQEYIRGRLPGMGLVAFVGDGSILPRRCGGCEEPAEDAVPFESPPSMRVELSLPTGRTVTGMGVPRGVTVVAGSAFHGKSTLVQAIAAGIYNHVPGDGRELVVSLRETMYLQSEDGRFISCVDVSPMVHDLPRGVDTTCFSTSDASGATSLAASIQEAVEAGVRVFILDEDTSATNMLYLDERGKALTRRHTITPVSELAASMREKGVSLIIVSTSSAPLLAAADHVVVMEDYRPRDATREAKRLVEEHGVPVGRAEYRPPRPRRIERVPLLEKPRVRAGRLEDKRLPVPVSLEADIQVYEEAQYHSLELVARELRRVEGMPVARAVEELEKMILERIEEARTPALAEVRAADIAFMLNRLPGLRTRN